MAKKAKKAKKAEGEEDQEGQEEVFRPGWSAQFRPGPQLG